MTWISAGWWLLYAGLGLMGIALLMEGVALWRLVMICLRELRSKSKAVRERIEAFRQRL